MYIYAHSLKLNLFLQVVAEGQPPVAASVRVSIREAPTRTDQRSSAKLKEYLSLSFLVIITAIGVLVHLFFIRRATEPISKNPSLIVASASAFVSLVSAFGLMFDTMRQMMSRGRLLGRDCPFSWSKLLLFLSTVSLAFTVIALIVSFLPKSYYYLPVVLAPTLPVVGISFYDVHPRADDVVLGGGDDPHKADRKRSFQLTINMTTFSFMGALGTIMGYHKNTNRADHIYVKVSIYFMLGAAVTGLVALLLNRLLRRKDWKRTAVGNAVMLGLLVLAVLIVAATFLGGVLAGTPFPVAIAAAIWYFMEYHVLCDDRGDMNAAFSQEKELKPLYTVSLTAMSVSFGAVMTVFAGFLGGEAKGGRLEVCVFFVVSCFLSSVSLGVITFRPPKKASLGAAAMALACITLVMLVLAALALVS